MKLHSAGWRSFLAIGLATLASTAVAQDLRVALDGAASVEVENRWSQPMTDIALFPAPGWSIDCSGGVGAARSSFPLLRVSEPQRCRGDASGAAKRSAVVATGKRMDGEVRVTHASRILMLNPGEGIVLVAGGAVHNDTDTDGRLDAGESIDYHYTLLNLGDLALSALALVDQSGAVSCPQTTLAVGASMVCTRNYVITGGDQTAGLIINPVDVDGQDSAARAVGASDVIVSQNLAGRAGVRVFKSPRIADDADDNNVVSVGDLIEYTFVVKNSGAEVLANVNLFEPDPDRIDTPIACSPTTLAGAPFSGIGTGSLTSTDLLLCTAQYTVRESDAAIRQVLNVAEVRAQAPVAGTVIATAASTVVVPVPPMIGVSKALISNVGIGPGPYAVRYAIVVENFGTVNLQQVQVTENLRQTFPLPVTFEVTSVTVDGTGAPNPAFDGIVDLNLLDESASSLVPGAQLIIDLRVSVSPGMMAGPFMNQVVASGRDSINQSVADVSTVGMDPDPDGNGDPDENDPTPVVFNVMTPPLNIPASSPAAMLLMLLLVGFTAIRFRPRG